MFKQIPPRQTTSLHSSLVQASFALFLLPLVLALFCVMGCSGDSDDNITRTDRSNQVERSDVETGDATPVGRPKRNKIKSISDGGERSSRGMAEE